MRIGQPTVSNLLLKENQCLVIPVYQRTYEWNSERWQGLIKDIFDRSQSDELKDHWIGIILISKFGESCRRGIPQWGHEDVQIIDGQQRILTLRLWLQALLDHANDNGNSREPLPFTNISCQEVDRIEFERAISGEWKKNWKTYGKKESGIMHAYTYFRYILWLGEDALGSGEPTALPAKSAKKQESNWNIFNEWQESISLANDRLKKRSMEVLDEPLARSKAPDVDSLVQTTLNALTIYSIEIQELDEEPSEIFDALNGQRMELEQFDHVRNYIFRGITNEKDKTNFYDSHWVRYETAFFQHKEALPKKPFNAFMYDYLISVGESKPQQRITMSRTKQQFVRYLDSPRNKIKDYELMATKSLLPGMRNWLSVHLDGKKFQIGDNSFELPTKCQKKLFLIQKLSKGPATPLLMNVINRYFSSDMSTQDQETLYKQICYIESYLARKVIVSAGLQTLRSQLMQISGQLGPDFLEKELQKALEEARPSDKEVQAALTPRNEVYQTTGKDLYERIGPKALLAIFQGIENYLQDQIQVNFFDEGENKFTIEHIFPQDWKLWGKDLAGWGIPVDDMRERLHVLGNLAIYPDRVNKELKNLPFKDKIDKLQEPEKRIPKLEINSKFISKTRWTPFEIDHRSKELTSIFLKTYL